MINIILISIIVLAVLNWGASDTEKLFNKKNKFKLNLHFYKDEWILNFFEPYEGDEEFGYFEEIQKYNLELIWKSSNIADSNLIVTDKELLDFLRDSY